MLIQNRLDLLSEYESIKSPLMNLNRDIVLKMIVDLGSKDQNGNKKRAYEEFRYKSNKYNNYEYLISGIMKFNSYLVIEYPNQDTTSNIKIKNIQIRDFAIDGLLKNMIDFDNKIMEAFRIGKNNELRLLSDKVIKIKSYPMSNSCIEFSQDIFEDNNGKDIGVRIGLNEEYWFTIRMSTTWKRFIYLLRTCDLYGWGLNMIQIYLSNLAGTAISELGTGTYNSASRYVQYWEEDPDDIINRADSVNIKRSKKVNNEERKKSFFDE